MSDPVVPTFDEAQEMLVEAMRRKGTPIDAIPPAMRAEATVGALALIEAMQAIGWRVSRPLKVAT